MLLCNFECQSRLESKIENEESNLFKEFPMILQWLRVIFEHAYDVDYVLPRVDPAIEPTVHCTPKPL